MPRSGRFALALMVFAPIACGGDPVPRDAAGADVGPLSDAGTPDTGVPDAGAPPDADATRCVGMPFLCVDTVAMGGPGCCGDSRRLQECVGDVGDGWQCPGGFVPASTCTGFWVPDHCGQPIPTRCNLPSDCVILPASCCGRCGVAAPDDMIAVHRDLVDENRAMACAEPVACPECAARPDPYLLATCEGGACTAVDLHVDPSTACTSDGQCSLVASSCCACGSIGADQALAVNGSTGSIGRLLCGEMPPPCPPCVPDFGTLRSACRAGRCVVVE